MIRQRAKDGYYLRIGDQAPIAHLKPPPKYKVDI